MVVIYEASPIKHARWTKAEIKSLDDSVVSVLTSDHPMTVRQVFYQLVAGGGIDKLEFQYAAIGRWLGILHRAGHIPRNIQQHLCEFLGENWPCCFQVEAVTREQIKLFNLPSRPTKKSDSRAKKFNGESVELDAIPPNTPRCMVRECFERHIDHDALAVLQVAEASERQALTMMACEVDSGAT